MRRPVAEDPPAGEAPASSAADRVLRGLATLGPVGHLPVAPGTAGSLVGLAAWLAVVPAVGWVPWILPWGIALMGVAASERVARSEPGADPPEVVIDEVAGMSLALALVPAGVAAGLAAFAAFRIFDIVKPFPADRLERLPGGWGIVADDLAAALYAAAVVRLGWVALGLG